MALETLPYTYTSQAEIEAKISASAGLLQVDHNQSLAIDASDESTVWSDVVSEATDIVNMYCLELYNDYDLASSLWVHRQATWIGCHLLCLERGNPSPGTFQSQFDRSIAYLDKIHNMTFRIPRLPTRTDNTPSLSNLAVDNWWFINKIRVQPSISTGGQSSKQDLDNNFIPFIYNFVPFAVPLLTFGALMA